MTDHELLELIAQKITKMETKLDAVSEQTADLAEFKSEIISRLDSIAESQKSLFEMYGEHEAEIRTLKRRPV